MARAVIHDLHVLTLEGMARSPEIAAAALARARTELDRVLPP